MKDLIERFEAESETEGKVCPHIVGGMLAKGGMGLDGAVSSSRCLRKACGYWAGDRCGMAQGKAVKS